MIINSNTRNQKKIIDQRCKSCFLNTFDRLFNKFGIDQKDKLAFLRFFDEAFVIHQHLSTPEIQVILNSRFCEIAHTNDPFKEEKTNSNQQALRLYPTWKERIQNAHEPFDLALRLALAGNIIDYGANNEHDLESTISNVLTAVFPIDHSHQLKEKIKVANRILYLGDNSGEIVFDKLFIETIKHPKVLFAVKGSPVLNDVTFEDAIETGINEVAKVVSNGYNAPSTILDKSAEEFLTEYKHADLIISKGQGNFEGLIHQNDPRIFFLFMVKCDVIAEQIKAPKGSFIVYNQSFK